MDSVATAKNIEELLKNPATWVVTAWILREIYRWFKKRNTDLEDYIKQNLTKMGELTIAIVRLETKLENIERIAYSVPKIEKDISALHSKFRQFVPDQSQP